MINFEKVNTELQELQESYQRLGQSAISSVLKDVFVEFPELKAITWAQYTPYFMDGDECIFSVNEIYFIENQEILDDDDISGYAYDEIEEDQGVFSKYSDNDKYDNISDFISQNEQIMKQFLGDHIEVTVTPQGIKTEEYDHD